ncbi:MAG: dihydrofolate reductase family protein [Anaerolineae bacterium]
MGVTRGTARGVMLRGRWDLIVAEPRPRPFVTLTFASSLDGSIAAQPGRPLALSGAESLRFTHQLRAAHDAILAGIGTVLADDPQLNVRLAAGPNPRPVILDSELRCPPRARCLDAARQTILAATHSAPLERERALVAAGGCVWRLPSAGADSSRIDLAPLLERLASEGIRTLMVEGGARVITSFLRARLVDRVILTLAPTFIGGVRGVVDLVSETGAFPRLRNMSIERAGQDLIVSGDLDWSP